MCKIPTRVLRIFTSRFNIILSLIPDGIGLEITFLGFKNTLSVSLWTWINVLCTCTTRQESVLHLSQSKFLLKLSSNITGKRWSTQKYTLHCSMHSAVWNLLYKADNYIVFHCVKGKIWGLYTGVWPEPFRLSSSLNSIFN